MKLSDIIFKCIGLGFCAFVAGRCVEAAQRYWILSRSSSYFYSMGAIVFIILWCVIVYSIFGKGETNATNECDNDSKQAD